MNNVKIFGHCEFGQIRTIVLNEQPWFIGKDVAEALQYSNPHKAIRNHVESEDKQTERIVQSGQGYNTIIINESGLYSLIFSSKLPSAKKFKHWITSEVLPQIRKTGSYGTSLDCMNAVHMILQASKQQLPYIVALLRQQGYELPYENKVQVRVDATEMKHLMKLNHITIRELERRTNICRSSLSYYMNGQCKPTSERYSQILKAITE